MLKVSLQENAESLLNKSDGDLNLIDKSIVDFNFSLFELIFNYKLSSIVDQKARLLLLLKVHLLNMIKREQLGTQKAKRLLNMEKE